MEAHGCSSKGEEASSLFAFFLGSSTWNDLTNFSMFFAYSDSIAACFFMNSALFRDSSTPSFVYASISFHRSCHHKKNKQKKWEKRKKKERDYSRGKR